MKKAETIKEWNEGTGKYVGVKDAAIEKAYRDTSFDGGKGEIISIAWAIEDEEIQSISRGLDLPETCIIRFFFELKGLTYI